jgi:L-2-hydroxyglutarate oxidase LhgO
MMDVEISIIGAGVVGLAIARELSALGKDLVVLERKRHFGQETSSRNSEVIHSGIYYPKDSLKAILCVEGNPLVYQYCEEHKIRYKKCGKLVVSQSDEENSYLDSLRKNGLQNGVAELSILEKEEIMAMEPHIRAQKALWVQSTGIVDSHALMKSLMGEAQQNGTQFAFESEVRNIDKISGGYRIHTLENGKNKFSFTSKYVINAAGLESGRIAERAGFKNPKYRINFCKGEYFRVKSPKNQLVARLIYPTPYQNLAGLGLHATIELDGGLKLGPNILFMEEAIYDYSVDPAHKEDFYRSAQAYLPFLEREDLVPEMSGIRPKLQAKGEPIQDFIIREESDAGYPGFINLIGIESPGLTSSLAIGKYVLKIIQS